MRKGIDSTFLHYGVRTEDMALIEQTCQDSDIDTEWLKEQILKPYNEERANQILIGEDREYTVEYEHGDTVWFVVDTDTWEKEGKIEPLRQFCSQKNGAISLEYDEVAKHASFKEYVNSTIAGGFNFEKDPVRLETAIVNAERNFQTDKESKLLDYSSEVFMLGKEIDGFVKSDIAKLVNKLK